MKRFFCAAVLLLISGNAMAKLEDPQMALDNDNRDCHHSSTIDLEKSSTAAAQPNDTGNVKTVDATERSTTH